MTSMAIACPTRAVFDIGALEQGSLGGIETASIELSRALAARGHRVLLASRTDRTVEEAGVLNVPLGDLARHSADVLISSNDARPFDAMPAQRKVLWLHNPMPIEKAVRRSQWGALVRHRPDAVFVGAKAEREMSRLYPFASRTVIPHGTSATFLTTENAAVRENRCVFASQRQRGLARTMESWTAHVAHAVPGASLHVFGTRAEEMHITPEAAARNNIVFHGPTRKADLAAFYGTAKAMIYPGAHDETFCMAAVEAQAMGLPVVTLGIGALSERVEHGIDGLVGRTYADLGNLARLLLVDEELWADLHRGALRARDLYTWRRAAMLWDTLVVGRDRLPLLTG